MRTAYLCLFLRLYITTQRILILINTLTIDNTISATNSVAFLSTTILLGFIVDAVVRVLLGEIFRKKLEKEQLLSEQFMSNMKLF